MKNLGRTLISKQHLKKWARRAVPFALLLLVVLSAFAYLQAHQTPLEIVEELQIYTYTARGQVNYEVELKPNILYEETILYNPQRVFIRLADTILIKVEYLVNINPEPSSFVTNLDIEVILSHPQVWTRRVNYTRLQSYSPSISHLIELELAHILGLAGNITKELDIPASKYVVEVRCYARSRFVVENVTRTLNHAFSWQMTIDLLGKIVDFSVKNIQESDIYRTTIARENNVTLGFIAITASMMRKMSTSLLLLSSVLSIGYVGVSTFRRLRNPTTVDVEKIKKKYGSYMIKGTSIYDATSTIVVRVKDLSELFRVSEELLKPVVYVETPEKHLFLVIDENVKYVFEIPVNRESRSHGISP